MTAEITNALVAQLRSSVRGVFLDADEMKELYYRNHRSNGQKNLRCFPRCSDTHVEHGFCGRPIRVLIFIPIGIVKLEDLLVIGEFRAVNEVNPTGVNKTCIIGEGGILESALEPKMRCKDQPMNQYYTSRETTRSKQEGFWEICVEFAVEYCSWHYGWKGGRFKQHIHHEFMVTVLTRQFQAVSPTRSKNLENLGQFSSPTFNINSLRRKSKRKGQELGMMHDDEDSELSTSILPGDSNSMISTSNDMSGSEKRSCYVQVANMTGEERADILAQAAAELQEELDSDEDSFESSSSSTGIPSCLSQGCTMTTLDASSSLPVYSSYVVFGQSPEQTMRGPPIGPLRDVDFVKSLLDLQDAFLRQQIQPKPSGANSDPKPENDDEDDLLHFVKKGGKPTKKKQPTVLTTGFLEAFPSSDKTSCVSSVTDADDSRYSTSTFSTGN